MLKLSSIVFLNQAVSIVASTIVCKKRGKIFFIGILMKNLFLLLSPFSLHKGCHLSKKPHCEKYRISTFKTAKSTRCDKIYQKIALQWTPFFKQNIHFLLIQCIAKHIHATCIFSLAAHPSPSGRVQNLHICTVGSKLKYPTTLWWKNGRKGSFSASAGDFRNVSLSAERLG